MFIGSCRAPALILFTVVAALASSCAVLFSPAPETNLSDSGTTSAASVLEITSPARSGRSLGPNSWNAVEISGTCDAEGEAVTVSGDATAATTCSNGSWSATLDFSAAADGRVQVTVTHGELSRVHSWNKDGYCTGTKLTNSPFAEASAGTESDPHMICTYTQLSQIQASPNDYYQLRQDIDGGDASYTGSSITSFDGNGFEISRLQISGSGAQGIFPSTSGLIKDLYIDDVDVTSTDDHAAILIGDANNTTAIDNVWISNSSATAGSGGRAGGIVGNGSASATIYRIRITDSVITSPDSIAGGIAGWPSGSIVDAEFSGTVNGDIAGGIAGEVSYIAIMNVRSSGTVTSAANGKAGGVIGWINGNTSLKNCHSSATVSSTGLGNGGIAGYVAGSAVYIENCHSTGDVLGTGLDGGGFGYFVNGFVYRSSSRGNVSSGGTAGGFIGGFGNGGLTQRLAVESFSTGNVTSTGTEVGGFVGSMVGGTILNSYTLGSVTGDDEVGGFIGRLDEGGGGEVFIKDCYAAGASLTVTTGPNSGGFAGLVSNSPTIENSYWNSDTLGVTGTVGSAKTTAELQDENEFTFWDFSTTWKYDSDITTSVYPILSWQNAISYFDPTPSEIAVGYSDELTKRIMGTCLVDGASVTVSGAVNKVLTCSDGFFGSYLDFTESSEGSVTLTVSHDNLSGAEVEIEETVQYDRSCATGTYATDLTYPKGNGADDPYWICNGEQLDNISATIDGTPGTTFILKDNVILPGSWTPNTVAFTGTFNGNNFSIKGLRAYGTGPRALFSDIDNGDITDLNIVGSAIYSTNDNIAILSIFAQNGWSVTDTNVFAAFGRSGAGANRKGIFARTSNGTVSGLRGIGCTMESSSSAAGGLFGYNADTSVTNSHFTGSIEGQAETAGLAGKINNTVDQCTVRAAIEGGNSSGGFTGTNQGDISNSSALVALTGGDNVGGMVGFGSTGSSISDSYAIGTIDGDQRVGGLLGVQQGTTSTSFAMANVQGTIDNVGGLVGQFNHATSGLIQESYATGPVYAAGDNAGGLVGMITAGGILDSFASGSVEGNDYVGGLFGNSAATDAIDTSYSYGVVTGAGGNVGEFGGIAPSGGGPINDCFWNSDVGGPGVDPAGATSLDNLTMQSQITFTNFTFPTIWDYDTSVSLFPILVNSP